MTWEKFNCEFCGCPTGPKSTCEDIPEKERLGKVMTVNGQIKPIYSKNCYFKRCNLHRAHVNFPVSRSLIEKLAPIPGIDSVLPESPYTFIVEIARAFDEEKVKREVTVVYKTFIKGKQALESTKKHIDQDNILIFPNGYQFKPKNDTEKAVARELSQMFGNIRPSGNSE